MKKLIHQVGRCLHIAILAALLLIILPLAACTGNGLAARPNNVLAAE